MQITFTKQQIRHFLISHYGLDQLDNFGKGKTGILAYITHVGSLQQDPLNIIGTNPDIILASRISDYHPELLRKLLYSDGTLMEGWDKEFSIYPTQDWTAFANIREASGNGALATIRYRKQEEALALIEEVKKKLTTSDSPLSAQDLQLGKSTTSRWGSADLGNIALTFLWSKGEAVIAERNERRKFYKSSTYLPQENAFDNFDDFLDWYVLRRLSGLGAYWAKNGAAWQGHFLTDRKIALERLEKFDKIVKITVEDLKTPLYLTRENYQKLVKICADNGTHNQLRFIAPLDNLIWDRKFIKEIFDFDYVLEVYKPVEKRLYGYYVLPILYGDSFIGRLEPDRDKSRNNTLQIKNLWFENESYDTAEIRAKIEKEVARYNQI
ncbi:MAG: winged helix DNA-binding domain-containing protein [Lactococcus hircilactis]